MKNIVSLLFLIGILLWVPASNADVYSWVDEKGVKHFGNQPPQDATDVRIVRSSLGLSHGGTLARRPGERSAIQAPSRSRATSSPRTPDGNRRLTAWEQKRQSGQGLTKR